MTSVRPPTQHVHVPRWELAAIAQSMAPLEDGGQHDIWGMFRDPDLTRVIVDNLSMPFTFERIDFVIGPESRGFLLGALVAQRLRAGFIPARKVDRYLPGDPLTAVSEPDWEGKRVLFAIQRHALHRRDRCLLVDDWYTTGNQGRAIARIVEAAGASLVATSVVVDEFCDQSQLVGLGTFRSLLHWDEPSGSFSTSTHCSSALGS